MPNQVEDWRLAYISRLNYPDPSANALQTVQMAAAFSRQTVETHLFVHDLREPRDVFGKHYGLLSLPLRIRSLRASSWPLKLYANGYTRFLAYNSAVALLLGIRPAWQSASAAPKVLLVRSRLEILYWGLLRRYLWWLRDWMFACEMHGLEPTSARQGERQPRDRSSLRMARMARALQNYDLVFAVSKGLAEDIRWATQNRVDPVVLALCSGLRRLAKPPTPRFSQGRILLGYAGSSDRARGVDDLLKAMELLPDRFALRIVGRIDSDLEGPLSSWLRDPSRQKRIQVVPRVPYSQIAAEIDAFDIALAPAGNTIHTARYASPLKIFDYMARGKPIVAADVPCHLEVLRDGVSARVYSAHRPESLATAIQDLAERPREAEALARTAWEQSSAHTYEVRAQHMLEIVSRHHRRGRVAPAGLAVKRG